MKLVLLTPLLLFFINFFTTSNFTNRSLNQEQINSVSHAHLKYQQLIAYAKEKNLDLNSVLSAEEKKMMQQGMDFLREFVPKIKGEAKAQLVGLEETIKEVGPKGFIDFVEDWVQDFKEYLKKFKNDEVLITIETVRAYLDGNVANPDFKVGRIFYSKIEAQLNALDKKASPKAIAEAISTGLDNFDANLKKVYKADKADYRAIKKKDLEDNILKPKDFYTWMQGVIKEEGGANKLEAEQLALKQEAEYKEFKEKFSEKIGEQITALNAIGSMGDADSVDMMIANLEKLYNKKKIVKNAAYCNFYKEEMVQTFLFEMKQHKRLVPLAEAKDIMENILLQSTTDKGLLKNLYKSYKSSEVASITSPTGFADWINRSKEEADFLSFKNKLTTWLKKVKNCIQVEENLLQGDKNKKLFSIRPQLFEQNIKTLFDFSLEGLNSQPGLKLFDIFSKEFASKKGQKKISIASVDTIWQNVVDDFAKTSIMEGLYREEFIKKSKDLRTISNAIEQLDSTYLPSDSSIIGALYDSKYIAKPLPKPKSTGNELMCAFELKKPGRDSSIKLVFGMDLRFVVQKDKDGKELYIHIPASNKKLLQQSANSYRVSLNQVSVGKTEYSRNNRLDAVTSFTWKLYVEDTSESTVVQEKMNAVFSYLDINVGELITGEKLSDYTGESALGEDLLKAKILISGGNNGQIKDIRGEFTLLGFTFVFGTGKDGWFAHLKNPFEPIPEERQFSYGVSSFDLYLSCSVHSSMRYCNKSYCVVSAQNGRLGTPKGGFVAEGIQLTDFKPTPVDYPVIIENTDK